MPMSTGGGLTLDPKNAAPQTTTYGDMLKSALNEALWTAPKPESEQTNPVVEEMVNRLQGQAASGEPAGIAPAMPSEAPDNTGVPDMNFNQPALEAPAEMQSPLTSSAPEAPEQAPNVAPEQAPNMAPNPTENPMPSPGVPEANPGDSTPVNMPNPSETQAALQSGPLPMPNAEILPPPPAPPVDFSAVPPATGPTLPPVAMPAAPEPQPVQVQAVAPDTTIPNQPMTQMPNPVAGGNYAVGNDPAVMNAVLNGDLASQPAPMAPTPAPMPNDPGTFRIPGA